MGDWEDGKEIGKHVILYKNGDVEVVISSKKKTFLVEYGSTKGYKRPNINKVKDFFHNHKIIYPGNISGIKKIPPTLKSFFEDKINNNIQLNKINKHSPIKLEDYPESMKEITDKNKQKKQPTSENNIKLKQKYHIKQQNTIDIKEEKLDLNLNDNNSYKINNQIYKSKK